HTVRCHTWSPWEKFKRATSIPASISRVNISGDSLTGPIVQTIFERRVDGFSLWAVLPSSMVPTSVIPPLPHRVRTALHAKNNYTKCHANGRPSGASLSRAEHTGARTGVVSRDSHGDWTCAAGQAMVHRQGDVGICLRKRQLGRA